MSPPVKEYLSEIHPAEIRSLRDRTAKALQKFASTIVLANDIDPCSMSCRVLRGSDGDEIT
jgi:hypothetical protein